MLAALFCFNDKQYRCALGKGGARIDKQEGDGATPVGCFPIRKVFYRLDNLGNPPETIFPTQALAQDDGGAMMSIFLNTIN